MKRGFVKQGLSKYQSKFPLFLATALACVWVNNAAATEVYKWTDEDGIVHYSDLPTGPEELETINVEGVDLLGTTGAYPQDIESENKASEVDEPGPVKLSAAQERREQIAHDREERREAQALSEQMCAKYRQRLEQVEPARRVYYTDDKGESIRLDDNQRMAMMSAENFISSTLIEGLDIRYLVVGDDFRFGKDRTGDFELLEKTGKENNFTVVSMPSFRIDGERVSSSGIRSALSDGDFNRAERLLGRHYHMAGKVSHGDKRGRQWGFPTANINMKRKVIPLRGIFAVEVFGLDHEPVFGVANLGTRPTVGGMRALLEVHLFDFDEQIYGRRINVLFRHKIREEIRFDSFDELLEKCRYYLAHEDERLSIAAAGRKRCIEGRYSNQERLARVLETIVERHLHGS